MMRHAALILLVLLLAGCQRGPASDVFVDSRNPPNLPTRFYPPAGWAWGAITPRGGAPMRYGVGGPAGMHKGDVLILVGHGRSAEAWFETAAALTASGYAVWILDGAGEGGSGRFARPRDLAHVPDFAFEAAGLRAMTDIVRRPVVLVAETTAAPTALSALAEGAPAAGVLLLNPVFDPIESPINAGAARSGAAGMAAAHLGWLRAAGQQPWRRSEAIPKGRPGVMAAWQQVNPDLRMGGVSWGWIAAFDRQVRGLTPARLKAVKPAVEMVRIGSRSLGAQATDICAALPRCALASADDPVTTVVATVDRTFANR